MLRTELCCLFDVIDPDSTISLVAELRMSVKNRRKIRKHFTQQSLSDDAAYFRF